MKKEILFRPGKDVHRHSPISVEMTAAKEGGRLWFGKSSWAMQDEKIDAWLKRHLNRPSIQPRSQQKSRGSLRIIIALWFKMAAVGAPQKVSSPS